MKSEWKDIAAEMTTTLKKNKRMKEVLQKTVEMFELADMVQIGRDQEEPTCEYCKGVNQITELISKIQDRVQSVLESGAIYPVEKPTYLQQQISKNNQVQNDLAYMPDDSDFNSNHQAVKDQQRK